MSCCSILLYHFSCPVVVSVSTASVPVPLCHLLIPPSSLLLNPQSFPQPFPGAVSLPCHCRAFVVLHTFILKANLPMPQPSPRLPAHKRTPFRALLRRPRCWTMPLPRRRRPHAFAQKARPLLPLLRLHCSSASPVPHRPHPTSLHMKANLLQPFYSHQSPVAHPLNPSSGIRFVSLSCRDMTFLLSKFVIPATKFERTRGSHWTGSPFPIGRRSKGPDWYYMRYLRGFIWYQ